MSFMKMASMASFSMIIILIAVMVDEFIAPATLSNRTQWRDCAGA